MGSFDDDDDETQPFDTQTSPLPGDNPKDSDFDHFLQNTLPCLETVPLDDGLETQVMNFEGETQVAIEDGLETQVTYFADEVHVPLEDGLETQVLNFEDDTQVWDDFDGFFNMDTTQLLAESNNEERDQTDGEESGKTEMLCDTDELSDTDSVKKVSCSPADRGNTTISKQDDKENKADLDALFYEETIKGVKMDFTSVRTAALRASGLAARNRANNKSNSELFSSKAGNEILKEVHASEDNSSASIRGSLVCALEIDGAVEDEQRKGVRDGSKDRNGNSAARRLFMDDDRFDEKEAPNDNYSDNADEMDLLQCNEISGLSYVDSQEPGDLSQANALDFVDKFLKSNDADIDKSVVIVGSTVKKSKPDLIIKGTQSLAKKSSLKRIADETRIFDWDDNCEDEGGGEFFSRQKKTFFENEGKGLSRSRTASKGHSSKRTAKKAMVAEVKKNLAKELDEQLNAGSLDREKATCSGEDLQDVGPDTQMAAEAMEDLYLGLDMTDKDTNKITKNTRKNSSVTEKEDIRLPMKYSLRKRSGSFSCEDLTIKSKQKKRSVTHPSNELPVLSSKQTKSVKKQHKDLDLDKSNDISPSCGKEQVHACTPVASRTRQHVGTKQPIAGNITCDTDIGTLSYRKGKRSQRKSSDNGHVPVNQFSKSKVSPQNFTVKHSITRKTRSSLRAGTVFPSSDKELETSLCNGSDKKEVIEESSRKCTVKDGNSNLDVSPGEKSKASVPTSITPASCTSSAVSASPICMGDEYLKQSCRKNLLKEIDSFSSLGSEPTSTMSDSRKRRDMTNVRVLFSHHLDDDIIKHQKKILAKLGASVAPSIREATHFVTDKFVRTRNMLEAIAFGKPVVTHLWVESCGQASCCIDERHYILRDAKKEKQFGFSLPVSLAQACQRPLLQGVKVWITPNTKPGVEILSSLVKAVHGSPVERIGRSVLNEEKIPDDLLALSCEEDYAACLPFLEKGGAVFSSELLLNGIVTQKLEYERHRLFDNHIKKTRTTRWLKRDRS